MHFFPWVYRDIRLSIVEHGRWSLIDKYETLNNGLSMDSLLPFVNAFKSQLWVEGLVQGNFTSKVSTKQSWQDLMDSAFADSKHWPLVHLTLFLPKSPFLLILCRC